MVFLRCHFVSLTIEFLQGSDPSSMWALKEDRHRGVGVSVLPQWQAIKEARAWRPLGENVAQKEAGPKFDVAQQFVSPQMLIGGRSSYLRFSTDSFKDSRF